MKFQRVRSPTLGQGDADPAQAPPGHSRQDNGVVTPERLSLARWRRSLTVTDLAARLDVAPSTLRAYERGRSQPDQDLLQCMCDELSFPPAFFTAAAHPELPEAAISFRAPAKVGARARASANSAAVLVVELYNWLEGEFHLPEVDLPLLPMPDPLTAAEVLRQQWGLGVTPIFRLMQLTEAKGIRLASVQPEHASIGSHSFWHNGIPYVLINTSLEVERIREDLAHELGHLVLHATSEPNCATAEKFGRGFLMPRRDVQARMPYAPLPDQIRKGAGLWGVPDTTLAQLLLELGKLDQHRYRSACVALTGLPAVSSPTHVEISTLLRKVFNHLRVRGIGLADIASSLAIRPDELHGLLRGIAITALNEYSTTTKHKRTTRCGSQSPRLTVV